MKIVLSTDPIKYPLTGIGRYTFELARGLERSKLDSLKFLHGVKLRAGLIEHSNCDQIPNAISPLRSFGHKSQLLTSSYGALARHLKSRSLRGLEDHLFHGPN